MPESSSIKGLRKNMFNIVDAQNAIHDDAILNGEPLAKDGFTAAVKGPGKILIDTGYYGMNELVGLHQIKMRWFSNIISGNGLTIQYWRKDKDGNEEKIYPNDIPWRSGISQIFGNGAGTCYFQENYQYRIKVISHFSLSNDDYVGIDYFTLKPIDEWGVRSVFIQAGTHSSAPRVLTTYIDSINVNGNGSQIATAHYSYMYPEVYEGLSPGDIKVTTGTIQDNTNVAWVTWIANRTMEGFDVAVWCSDTGGWTGFTTVNLTISAYAYVILL